MNAAQLERYALAALPGFGQLPFATLMMGNVRFLLIAGSHGGKSTLAAHLIAPDAVPQTAKAMLIDDNLTWFDPWDRAICVGRALVLRREAWQMLQAKPPALRHLGAYPHDSGAVAGRPIAMARVLSRHPIDALIYLTRHSGAVDIRALSQNDADIWASYTLRQRLGQLPRAHDLRLLGRLVSNARRGRFALSFDTPQDGVAGMMQIWRQAVQA